MMTDTKLTKELTQISLSARTWVEQAGHIAMDSFQTVAFEYKADRTFVTQVDRDIETLLVKNIRATYPSHHLIGEEGTNFQAEGQSPYTWVLDPLDGTTVFVRGLPGWGISVGLMYNLEPVFGLFYMPLLNDLSYTTPGQTICQNKPLAQSVPNTWQNKGFLAISASSHADFNIKLPRTRTLGSVGASLTYTARGSATAAFIPKAHVWDLVAGAAILNRTGGELRYLSGAPLNYANLCDGRLAPEPIIAGHPDILDDLAPKITPL